MPPVNTSLTDLLEELIYRTLRIPVFALLRLFRRHAGRRDK